MQGIRISLFVLFGLSPSVYAQTLSWEQCVTEAQKNNAAIKSALQSWQASESDIKVSRAPYFPEVDADFSANYGRTMFGIDQNAQDRYVASVTVKENIFNGFADKARVEQAEANSEIAEAQLQIVKAQTSFDLKSAYANLVYAQRSIRLQENIRDRRKSNLNLVDLRFENGSENKGSVLLSQAYLDQADLNIIQAKNSILTANAQLARAVGRDETTLITVAEDIPTLEIPQSVNFQALAIQTPRRSQAVFREKSAESGITLAKAGYFPSLGVSGTYGREDRDFFPRDDKWSVGLQVNIPIFNGGRDYYTTQSAISNRSAAGSNREDLDRELVTTLSSSLARLTEAKKNLEVTTSFLRATEMRAEIGRGRYNNGLLSFDDWDLIESDLISRQQAYIASQRDYVLAEATWENALGTGSIK